MSVSRPCDDLPVDSVTRELNLAPEVIGYLFCFSINIKRVNGPVLNSWSDGNDSAFRFS